MDAPGKRRWPIVVGAVVGALVLVVIIGLFVLDSVLTSKAHDEATKLSQQLGRPVTIGAQSYLLDWYGSFGFAPCGPEYVEDGIRHTPMTLVV